MNSSTHNVILNALPQDRGDRKSPYNTIRLSPRYPKNLPLLYLESINVRSEREDVSSGKKTLEAVTV